MKNNRFNKLLLIFTIVIFSACGSSMSVAEKEQLVAEIDNGIKESDFTFKATYAHPTGFKSVYLSPFYDVKISADTVKAYLPYYGRAYTATLDPSKGGYNFTSTDFDYNFSPGSKPGNWRVSIRFNDLDRHVQFNFDIWENGSGRLSVNDVNRQTISFQGDIVTKKE